MENISDVINKQIDEVVQFIDSWSDKNAQETLDIILESQHSLDGMIKALGAIAICADANDQWHISDACWKIVGTLIVQFNHRHAYEPPRS